MASPAVQVKNGAAAYVGTTNGNNATPGNTQTIQLISQAGVSSWSISCVNTDELSSASTVTASLVVDNLNKTATFTAPAAGRAYMFQSQINSGINPSTGAVDPTASYTFVVYTLTGGGARVLCANETTEGNATAGWIAPVNTIIRNPNAQPSALAGTPGLVQLAGDLAGNGSTAATPLVSGITGDVTGFANIAGNVKNTSNPKVTSIEYAISVAPPGVNTAVTALTIPTLTGKVYTIRGIVAFHNASANAYGEFEINAFANNVGGTVTLLTNTVTNKISNAAFAVALSTSSTNILVSVTDPTGATQSRRITGSLYVAERSW